MNLIYFHLLSLSLQLIPLHSLINIKPKIHNIVFPRKYDIKLSDSEKNSVKFLPFEDDKLVKENIESEKYRPQLLFLPGLDGIGSYSSESFFNLSRSFEISKVYIEPSDRTNFLDLATTLIKHLEGYKEPPILMGESFGGLLACYVAVFARKLVSKLILVNPATSYDSTNWPILGSLITNSGPIFPIAGLSTLIATSIETYQIESIGRKIIDRIKTIDDFVYEANLLYNSSQEMTNILNPETLQWRLSKWLESGSFLLKGRYKEIKVPTLILIGSNDRLLPSLSEGRRLEEELVNTEVDLIEFRDKGHALLDDSFNLEEVIMKSKIFSSSIPVKPPNFDIEFPSKDDISGLNKQLDFLIKGTSPIFLSVGGDKKIRRGIKSVPTGKELGRPVLFVGNHQLYGADLGIIIKEFIDQKQTLIRGLAHPFVFNDVSTGDFGSNNNNSMKSLFTKFGAVEVSPGSIFELLKRNESVLLFPGGVREAYHGKGEDNVIFWPEKIDFVRMAGLLNAVIVPFSAIGVADSVNMILDGDDLMKIPVFNERIRRSNSKIPNARAGIKDNIIAPISAPKLPSRFYFLFHEV